MDHDGNRPATEGWTTNPSAAAAPKRGEDLPDVQLVTDTEALKVITDPLRRHLRRLLVEREYTVKELGDILGEDATRRLYYHVNELERTCFVRLVRTEVVSGIQQKYYRAVAKNLHFPASLLRDDQASGSSQAMLDVFASRLEHTLLEVRHLVERHADLLDDDHFDVASSSARTTPELAEEFRRRYRELIDFLEEIDRTDGTEEISFTRVLMPGSLFEFTTVESKPTRKRERPNPVRLNSAPPEPVLFPKAAED
jgi:hypothetical protein